MFWSIVLPSDQARSNYCCVQSGHSKPLPVTKQIETFSTPIAPYRPKKERGFIRVVAIAVCVEETLLKGIYLYMPSSTQVFSNLYKLYKPSTGGIKLPPQTPQIGDVNSFS